MKKYSPDFLGKVIPADNPEKITNFCNNQYDSFTSVFNTVKNHSDNISDISAKNAGDDTSTLTVTLTTDDDTMKAIAASADESTQVQGDTITVTK